MTLPSTTLRPLGMGELLDRAIRLYRQNFFKCIGVIALMQIPLAGLNLIVSLFTYDATLGALPDPSQITPDANPFSLFGPGYFTAIGISIFVGILYLVLVGGIASAALTRLVADAYLGKEQDVLGAYEDIGDRWKPLVRAIFLYIGFGMLVVFWTILPCIGWLTGPGMLMVLAGLVLPLVAPVVVLESFGARASLRRAWELVRGRFWWVFGFMLLLYLFNWVVVSGPSLLVSTALETLIPGSLRQNPQMLYNVQVTVQTLVSLVFNLLYLPLQLTCFTLLYFDLRVRQEGLDLLISAGGEEVDLRELIAHTPRIPSTSLLSGVDLRNFAALSAALIAIYVVVVIVAAGLISLFGLS